MSISKEFLSGCWVLVNVELAIIHWLNAAGPCRLLEDIVDHEFAIFVKEEYISCPVFYRSKVNWLVDLFIFYACEA